MVALGLHHRGSVGLALYDVAARRHWFDRPGWAIAIVAAGLVTLGIGFALDRRGRGRQAAETDRPGW